MSGIRTCTGEIYSLSYPTPLARHDFEVTDDTQTWTLIFTLHEYKGNLHGNVWLSKAGVASRLVNEVVWRETTNSPHLLAALAYTLLAVHGGCLEKYGAKIFLNRNALLAGIEKLAQQHHCDKAVKP